MSPSAESSAPGSSSPESSAPDPSSPKSSRRPEWLNRVVWICVFTVALAAGIGYGVYALAQHLYPTELNVTVTFRAQGTPGVQVTSRKLQSCVATIEGRLSNLDISSFEVTTEGEDRILLALPEGTDVDAVTAVILQRGDLTFYDVADFGEKYDSAEQALAAAGVTSTDELPSGTTLIFWPADGQLKDTDEYYLAATPPALTGEMLREAAYDDRTDQGSYRITMEFTEEGAAAFARTTQELAAVGVATGVMQQLAIVLDGTVYSAPTVQEEVTGGVAEITGSFTLQEARDLVAVLQTGAMPLRLVRED
jgi:preprotein translocase subunit SecD